MMPTGFRPLLRDMLNSVSMYLGLYFLLTTQPRSYCATLASLLLSVTTLTVRMGCTGCVGDHSAPAASNSSTVHGVVRVMPLRIASTSLAAIAGASLPHACRTYVSTALTSSSER